MIRNWMQLLRDLPVDDEDQAVEELAQRIVREHMSAAAILFFESAKPMGFIGGQALIAATPLLGGFIEPMRLEQYASLLSNRRIVERLIRRIEELEDERAGEHKRKVEKKGDNREG